MSALNRPILVVEDDANDFFFLKRAFGIAQIQNQFCHVENGQQAIDYLRGVSPFSDRTAYPLPSLILLDLKLPIKHGFEVLTWIKQQPLLRGIIVVIFTSSNEESDVAKAYEMGANAFLVKPTSAEKLTEIARAIEVFWLRQNRFKARP